MEDQTKDPLAKQADRRWTWAGFGLLIALWWILAVLSGPLVISPPPDALRALGGMLAGPEFYEHFSLTILRIGAMVLVAAGVAGILAGLALWDRRIARLIEPSRRVFATIPPVIVVVIVMFWLGMGSRMIIVFGGLILWPVMYINLLEGSEYLGADLRETARAFGISLWNRVRHFYLPAIAPAALAGLVLVLCSSIRVVVLAELLGADEGMGAAIADNARALAVDQMTAWVLVVLVLAVGSEQALVGPIRRRVYRWKKP